jgi:poly(hydroxyalkanoate) depolymerase family esterase
MQQQMQAAMAEATRLTRAGQLAEATALIQRTLGNQPASGMSTPAPPHVRDPIGPQLPVVEAPAAPAVTPGPGRGQEAGASGVAALLRRVAKPPARSPHRLRPAGGARPYLSDAAAVARAAGRFLDESYTNAAGTRAYKLYIPNGYTGQAVPLIVILHGGTQTAVDFAAGTSMNALAERDMFLVAYPEQATSANPLRCWNWFQAADQRRGAGEPSLIAGITRQIMGAYQVDARRVYVAGFSAGGAMAAVMAVTYPDLYAAVGVHSGLTYGAAHDLPSAFAAMKQGKSPGAREPAGTIPLIVFHGDHDTIVNRVNADDLLNDWGRPSTPEHGGPGRPARAAPVRSGQLPGGHAYTCLVSPDASDGTAVEQWIIHQAGHAWSGGSPHGSYTDPQGPDASAELVRFFNDHPSSPVTASGRIRPSTGR